MSQQKFTPVPSHLPPPNNLYHSHQHLTLTSSNYPATPRLQTPPDALSSLGPHYLPNQVPQLNPFNLPLLNIMSPFSKQLFPNGSQLFPANPYCQLLPAWLPLPQTAPPTTPPPLHKLPPKSPPHEKNQRSSSIFHNHMHNYHDHMHNYHDQSTTEAREIASATCLKAQEDFNMSSCTDDIAIALTLCCSATTRLSSIIDDPPPEWDEHTLHQLKNTRKRYSERWRGLYRIFILKKISDQPPSPIPDNAGKKTKVQLSQYIQSSDEVQKTPKKSLNKPLKSILKKPGRKSSDGMENNKSLSSSSLSLSASSCSLETVSTSNSSFTTSLPPLFRETGTQTSPVSMKQLPPDEKSPKYFPSITRTNHYMRTAYDPVPINRSTTVTDSSKCSKNKENLPPGTNSLRFSKNLPMKRATSFTPPPPRRFSPEEHHRVAWTGLCTDV